MSRPRSTGTLLAAACILALLSGCARSSISGSGDSGVQGRVLVGPTCPVEQAGSACPDRPLATDLEIVRGSDVVATVHSGSDGSFRVALEPGRYTIRPGENTTGGLPRGTPVGVTVSSHSFASVTVTFDSGIR
jgi:hypothetical protein